MKLVKAFTFLSAILVLFSACQANDQEGLTQDYTLEEFSILSADLNLPPSPFSYGSGNPASEIETNHIGTFGRTLFYDKKLSSDGTVSCANCHQQSLAFADDKAFSGGANNNITDRNSIALGSFRSFGSHYKETTDGSIVQGLFWDERAGSIKEQLRQTINNPNEMDMNLEQITDLVESIDYYRVLHQKAFDTPDITEDQILEALETFINSIESKKTKLEFEVLSELNFISGDEIVGTSKHQLGADLFIKNCNSCHNVGLNFLVENESITSISSANNGLQSELIDFGVFQHTQNPEDLGKFKIPGLHNVELTAPYMHDGRFETLEEVVEFYNTGVNFSQTLHPFLREEQSAKRLNLTEEEKIALVSFLKLMTDEKIVSEEKWSDPFLQ